MGEMWETGTSAAQRSRELKSMGLGDFAALVVDIEALPEAHDPQMAAHPGPENSSTGLSDDEMSLFESHFLQGTEQLEAPSQGERQSSISFASAFKIVQSHREGSARQVSSNTGDTHLDAKNRFHSIIADRGDAPAGAQLQISGRPRPEGGSTFNLGAFYDRVGLADEEATAISRILAHDEKTQGAAFDPAGERKRIEEALNALDIDLEASFDGEDGREIGAEANMDGGADNHSDVGDASTEERLTLVLDGALARSLIEAAEARGLRAEDTALEALRAVCADLNIVEAEEPAKLAVPEEPPIAGSAPFAAA